MNTAKVPTQEEKIREYYARCQTTATIAEYNGNEVRAQHYSGMAIGASITLDILGIKIEGVNA